MVTKSDVTTAGVTVVRNDVTPNVTEPPSPQIPTVATPVSWTALPGGPTITYLVTCNYKKQKNPNKGSTVQLQQTVTLTGNTSYTFNTSN
jgi:hypothetical protein